VQSAEVNESPQGQALTDEVVRIVQQRKEQLVWIFAGFDGQISSRTVK